MVATEKNKLIQRVDLVPTTEILIEKMSYDSVGRNKDLIAFLNLIDAVKGGYSFFIDGKWGDGKTFFIKQAILLIEYLNENLESDNEKQGTLFSQGKPFQTLEMQDSYLPVYYNAWEHDSFSDPLITLMGVMATSNKNIDWDDITPTSTKSKITSTIDVILSAIAPFIAMNIGGIAKQLDEAFTGEHLLNSMKSEKEIQSKLQELVQALLAERANKLILFIDELDRCNPAFALKLLERIKFFFEQDNIIIVFSTYLTQLAYTVGGFYGEGIDGEKYLSRFYDQKLTLTKVKETDYLSLLGIDNEASCINIVAHEMVTQFNFSMRDCNRYYRALSDIYTPKGRISHQDNKARLFFENILVPILMAINIKDSDEYQQIVDGTGYELLKSIVLNNKTIKDYMENLVSTGTLNEEEFLSNTYTAAFKKEPIPIEDPLVRRWFEIVRTNAERLLSIRSTQTQT
jgi:hypothetical protein